MLLTWASGDHSWALSYRIRVKGCNEVVEENGGDTGGSKIRVRGGGLRMGRGVAEETGCVWIEIRS